MQTVPNIGEAVMDQSKANAFTARWWAWFKDVGTAVKNIPSLPTNANGVVLGLPYVVYNANLTGRNTTTLTIDPHLQFTSIPAGQYLFQCFIAFNGSVGTVGLKFNIAYTGSTTRGYLYGNGVVAGAGVGGFLQNGAGTGPFVFSNISTLAPSDFLVISAVVISSAAGTIGLNWAPNAAGTVNIGGDNWASLTPLA